MGKMIAKTIIGAEYCYSRTSAHAAPTSSANAICARLNEIRWNLKDNEAWHVYDCDSYEMEYTNAGIQRFGRRNGNIYEARGVRA